MSGDETSSHEALTAGPPPGAAVGADLPVRGALEPNGVSGAEAPPLAEPPALEVTGRREASPEAPDAGRAAGGEADAFEGSEGPADPDHAAGTEGMVADRFEVDVPGYRGSLPGLVARAQRGDVDLTAVPVNSLTSAYRRAVAAAHPPVEPREIADFLGLAARLLTLKAQQVIPDGPLDGMPDEPDGLDESGDEPGRRLAEYRLFRAAADALLSEAAEEGTRSFLGLVSPEVIPVERLAIPPERLAAAFRAVLLRLDAREEVLAGVPTFSVEDKLGALQALLAERGQVGFEELFAGVSSRMEAVAVFLALLELIRRAGARVEQRQPFGPITVSSVA